MENSAAEQNLRRQVSLARYLLLGTVIITVLDLAALLLKWDLFAPYCAAVPYYLVWLGMGMDNDFAPYWTDVGTYTATALAMAFVLLAVWLALWFGARRHGKWLKVGLAAVCVDTAALLVVALAVMEDPLSCLLELVIHGAVIWEMHQGIQAQKKLDAVVAVQG